MSKLSKRVAALLAAGAGAGALAVANVQDFEGYSSVAYQDAAKVWTICAGHTTGVRSGQYAAPDECAAWLESDLGHAFAVIDRTVKIDLPEPTRAALASFIFNVGEGAFERSTLLRKLNVGDIPGACDQLLRWDRIGQSISRGLARRRAAERELCLAGVTP